MRDQHRGKNELIDEVTGLRKQVADLKQAQLERRRIEEGLRKSEEEQRMLLDAAPVGVGLLTPAGEPVLANARLAGMLGYQSPRELVQLGSTLGLLADEAGREWLRDRASDPSPGQVGAISLRRRDGTVVAFSAMGERHDGGNQVAVVLLGPAGALIPG